MPRTKYFWAGILATILCVCCATLARGQCCYCPYSYCIDPSSGICADTPIIIDTDGTGFHLTSVQDGVVFGFCGTRAKRHAWTESGSTNAFLFLDRDRNGLADIGPDASLFTEADRNGVVDNGFELFGNCTPQSLHGRARNGFAALAVFDSPGYGGNGDGTIDKYDKVFPQLRVWVDANHDGVSQQTEVFTLDQVGVEAIFLNYKEMRREDGNGNELRYRARIRLANAPNNDHWAYDVILAQESGAN